MYLLPKEALTLPPPIPVEEQEDGDSRYDRVQRLFTAVNELRSDLEGELRLKRQFEACTSQYRQKQFSDGIERCLLMTDSSRLPKQKQVKILIALNTITGQNLDPVSEPVPTQDPTSERETLFIPHSLEEVKMICNSGRYERKIHFCE